MHVMKKYNSKIEKCKKDKEISFYIENDDIKNLPNELFSLSHLKILDVRNNFIQEIPTEIGNLRNLEILDLRGNSLNELPYEISFLNKLEEINIQGNSIKELPAEIINLTNLKRINVQGNPLTKPPIEVASRGIGAIRNYFNSIVSSKENIKLFEAKLLIVGEGNVGKTCLMRGIVKQEDTDEISTTEGIEIKEWKFTNNNKGDYRINIWDFGGQEIYHSTHQFFLTKRSIYVFVWSARTDDNLLTFDYWLNILKLLGDNSPVFVVQNKIDERVKNIDEAAIQRKFKNIVGFHKVSALKNTNLDKLISEINKAFVNLDHVGDTLPKVWYDIRTDLELKDVEFITLKEYYEICGKYNLDEKQALFLGQYYHDIGVFLHFQDNSILRDLVFLKPEWATNAVYKLIDTKDVILNYGRFSFSDLQKLWSEYPTEYHFHLVELMKKFELCFKLDETDDYIIPELLNNESIEYNLPFEEILSVKYKYDFMPKGIITRLIVRLHDLIKDNFYWKNGIIIERQGTEAILVGDKLNSVLTIKVGGYDKNGLLNIITREIDKIHKSLNYPKVSRMIPCICEECTASDSPHYFAYDTLKKYQEKEKSLITCQKSIEEINIETALKGIEGKLPLGTKEGNNLLNKLKMCPMGQNGWREFEVIGSKIFEYLFKDDFNKYTSKEQAAGAQGSQRKDLIINNNFKDSASFFSRIYHDYQAKAIVVDFKNYENKLTQNEFFIPSKYMNAYVGNFIIVISRYGIDNGAKELQKSQFIDGKFMLSLKSLDLIEMIKLKMKGDDPKKILENLLFEIISVN